jgi:LAO/AO transport system kinase
LEAQVHIEEIVEGLGKGQIRFLSRAITLIESTAEKDLAQADALLDKLAGQESESHRIAITGVPGVGKSTFIDRLGMHFMQKGKKVAVLAVDPTSRISQGSILGDKTRMERLSAEPKAFIRPSPAADTLGGVARKTREAILLCEAAGFDIILIETVGVGQSEIEVKDMADTFLLLMLAGAGDELQGIKRGIMEMADLVVINKAEEETLSVAREAASNYTSALHLLGQQGEWTQRVQLMSSLTGFNEESVFQDIEDHYSYLKESDELYSHRRLQQVKWFNSSLDDEVLKRFFAGKGIAAKAERMKDALKKGELSVRTALKLMLED